MRAVVQRVKHAQVTVEGEITGKIGHGLLVLIAVHVDDQPQQCVWMADKITNLRIFCDDEDKMNHSIQDVRGEILAVSQFTLYGDCSKGRRPAFIASAPAEKGRELYEQFVREIEQRMGHVQTGRFAAKMEVDLLNDGPVTLVIDSPNP